MEDLFDIINNIDKDVRHLEVVKELTGVRQGDMYIINITAPTVEARNSLAKTLNETATKYSVAPLAFGDIGKPTTNRQLVNGISTGSRHCISPQDLAVVTILARSHNAHELEGPMIIATSRFTIEHPEHAHCSLPAGTYQVLYQRDFRTGLRVQD